MRLCRSLQVPVPVELLKGQLEALDLDRVTEWRSSPVALDEADGARIDAGLPVRLGDQAALGLRVRRRQRRRAAPMVFNRASDNAEDRITVSLREV